ncbi:MAG TPA: hypothetical protein VI461_02005 [Chitinophagaceae bacterium]|nr:hypothetical protein [Chitinophagaceae bacterium]
MRKPGFDFLVLILTLCPLSMFAQSGISLPMVLKEEKTRLLDSINYIDNDLDITNGLSRIIESETDSVYLFITSDTSLSTTEREKAIRSLVYFMQGINKHITRQKLLMYDIPGALQSYKSILQALLYHKPFTDLIMPLAPHRSQLMATSFSQYNEYALLDDIAVYKRVAAAPEFILRFLENKPSFPYADSLLLKAAVYDPAKLFSYLRRGRPALQNMIGAAKNIYLREMLSLSWNKNAGELLPFVTLLAEKRITPDSILNSRMNVTRYFQLLVNTLNESKESTSPSVIFQKLLRDGLKEKSLSFYVKPINELHNASDAVRFASVKGLRPEDMYYIMTSGGEELYTSSYLGLYKRLMEDFKNQSADSLFDIVQYDNFRIFMQLAANYNTLTDFLSRMSVEKAARLLQRFIVGIESNVNTGLEKAMDIADSFTGLGSPYIAWLVEMELQSNLVRCRNTQQYFGVRLYSILLQVFGLVKKKDDLNKLWGTLGNYELLKRNALQNENGEIVELVLFYGDEDGVASFNNFQKLFADKSKWEIAKNTSWITIRSLSNESINIYASMPLDYKEEMDLRAQDSLIAFLEQQSVEPAVLIHRGHSYHLDKTLKRLKPSVKLAILGSCGAHNSAISIASISPDVQIIGSKKMGSMSINDPIIDAINETLQNKEDLSWPLIWETLRTRFRKDRLTLNAFNEYIPPAKNVSLFVLKLFNFYNRPVDVANY